MKIERSLLTSPEFTGLRRLPQRAVFFHFHNQDEALKVKKELSPYTLDLNGEWDFAYTETPETLEAEELFKENLSWSKAQVPDSFVMRGFDHPHYTNTQMPFPELSPEIPEKNPTGIYRKEFTLPSGWEKRRNILHFDGAESSLFLFVNGCFAGASQDSRGAAEFDLTDLLHAGVNRIAAVVCKWSDGTFLEDQDHWYLPGLTRSVYLYSTGSDYVADVFARTTLAEDLHTGVLDLELFCGIHTDAGKDGSISAMLQAPDGKSIALGELKDTDSAGMFGNSSDPARLRRELHAEIPEIQPWSAETPHLYTLVAGIRDKEGKVLDVVSVKVGFRRYEIRKREFLVNGKAVQIHGVNRHEHHPEFGKAVPYETSVRDVQLMKQFNVNAVRTSHYPAAPEFYDLCDEYGLYVIDECNLEHHAFYNDFCRNPQYAPAFLDRAVHLMERDKNHACIYAWSLGNESGCGANHAAMAGYLRFRDPSRLIHYEGALPRGQWHVRKAPRELTDFIAPMYPHLNTMQKWSDANDDDRPMILCEYSHSMGNSNGGLAEYFQAFDTMPGVQGGFIWEWLDHGITRTAPDGRKYWAYGGDFGDEPNSKNFCTDGIVWPDRTPHPALYEFKHLARPVQVRKADEAGAVEIFNCRYFTGVEDLELRWKIEVDGTAVLSGTEPLPELQPREKKVLRLPVSIPEVFPGEKIVLIVSLLQKEKTLWAPAGFECGTDSFELAPVVLKGSPSPAPIPVETVQTMPGQAEMSAGSFKARFTDAGMVSLISEGEEVIQRGFVLNFWRAATDNDGIKLMPERKAGALTRWLELGYNQLELLTDRFHCAGECVELHTLAHAPGILQEEIEFTQRFRPLKNGAIEALFEFIIPPEFEYPPRIGVTLELPKKFHKVEYFGLGPEENYIDRCAGARLGRFRTTAEEMYTPYIMPQACGNRTKVEYASFTDETGRGLLITAPGTMEFSALRYSEEQLWKSFHTCDLHEEDAVIVNLDLRQRGLGTRSCGPDPWAAYEILPGKMRFALLLAPLGPGADAARKARELLH